MTATDQSNLKSAATAALSVFISYARQDVAVAEQVEAFLRAAGVRVFRDRKDIHSGDNWPHVIEQELRQCQRMVLLLSGHSMPYHKESYLEWFFFDGERKPIHPLLIQSCDLFYRLRVYHHLDARKDLPAALTQLLADLRADFDLPHPSTDAEKISIVASPQVEARSVSEALQALRAAVLDPQGGVVLSLEQACAVKDHKPADLDEYRLGRIAEWSLPRYTLDKRFVNLTLLLDKGETETQRWHKAEDFRFNDLRAVLAQTPDDPALVLLGAPGSGKSTLLRRFQLDHSLERLRDGGPQVTFFAPLNSYRAAAQGSLPEPREWLAARWARDYPQLPALEPQLQHGQVLLLLDALNEMPHQSAADYHRLVGLWRDFIHEATRQGNRIVFSCRSLDYSASLSSPLLRVPQIEVQPLEAAQMQTFLAAYCQAHAARLWLALKDTPQFKLYQTPYFLKLLCDQIEATGELPKGRAELFTGFVRQALQRERTGELFGLAGGLLSEADHQKLSLGNRWRNAFELPERGVLLPKLAELAFAMQRRSLETEGAQVRIDYDAACDLLADPQAERLLKAGLALNVLDQDVAQFEITFFHQLLQEYFAARQLAKAPDPALVHVEWTTDKARPALAETVAGLADGDPLPPLPQTGWEETTLTAAPMARDPQAFIRALLVVNLPLAGRCAAAPEAQVSETLKDELRAALRQRAQDFAQADLRARIAAGEALGLLGDPRFKLGGSQGQCLLPPLVKIAGGKYTIGDDKGEYDREKPAHTVELAAFEIGQFPVTNAEYAKFIEARGYADEQWWDTPSASAWLKEGGSEGAKESWRETRQLLQRNWSEAEIRKQANFTPEQKDQYIEVRNETDEEFEQRLEEWFPVGKLYREPEYWNDTRFNNPAQPVVGVTWYEARAYCNWLTANASDGRLYRLPTEFEFEAAARGKAGRQFPYGKKFDHRRCNTFESHLRRTTPVGIFDNATPEGAYDLIGNAYTWTLSIYDQQRFPYPYRPDAGREDVSAIDVKRVLRGGAWDNLQLLARAVYRFNNPPGFRDYLTGFRVVVVSPPS